MPRIMMFLILAWFLTACASARETAAPGDSLTLAISSASFAAGEAIPAVYSCQGEDQSPPLAWDEPPAGTQTLALVMDDPDAPLGTWVHWVLYNLPAETRGLAEGAGTANQPAALPDGAQVGQNSWKRQDYGGPCPPSGTHRYVFRLYALDTSLAGSALDKAALQKAMDGHILGQGELTGTYTK